MRKFVLAVLLCVSFAAYAATEVGVDAPAGECRSIDRMGVVMRGWGFVPMYVPRAGLNKLRADDENIPPGDDALIGVREDKQAAVIAIFRDGCMVGRGVMARDRVQRILTEQGA